LAHSHKVQCGAAASIVTPCPSQGRLGLRWPKHTCASSGQTTHFCTPIHLSRMPQRPADIMLVDFTSNSCFQGTLLWLCGRDRRCVGRPVEAVGGFDSQGSPVCTYLCDVLGLVSISALPCEAAHRDIAGAKKSEDTGITPHPAPLPQANPLAHLNVIHMCVFACAPYAHARTAHPCAPCTRVACAKQAYRGRLALRLLQLRLHCRWQAVCGHCASELAQVVCR